MDMSFMSKFAVTGHDAGRFLDRLSANAVDGGVEPGTITYTQWLNERGTLEADLTVTKRGDDDFWVVASDTVHRHVLAWMRRQAECDDAAWRVAIADLTSAYAQINVQGPRSRELLSEVTSADVSNDAFPYRHAAEIDVGFARVLCVRITYLGELGYELYVPAEQAVHVYERLVAAGEATGARHAGLKALASLRMEKAYRDYGHDVDNTDNAFEAGLGFAVALDKPGGFIGRDAAAAQKAAGPPARRLVQLLLQDPEPLLFHAEVVRRDGDVVGYVRAGSYGWTLGGAVGLAMVERRDGRPLDGTWVKDATWDVDVAGRRVPAVASLRPMYDPDMERIKV
jgi:4-methylaminobutanoate oxidase (formaldehyde-forming)